VRSRRSATLASYGYGYGKIDESELGASPRIRSVADLPAALGVSV